MKQARRPNNQLRHQRDLRGWSQARLAASLQELGGAADSKLVGKWERGVIHPSPFYREKLCLIYGKTADQLGLLTNPTNPGKEESLRSITNETVNAINELSEEGLDMNRSRRSFLQLVGDVSVTLSLPGAISPITRQPAARTSNSVIESLVTITQNYRNLQRAGIPTEASLRDHIVLIQHTLETTIHEGYRRELWRILAQSQLLARHSVTRKTQLGRARTWNEAALASAQYSGDAFLIGAALGHLGHLYLIWLDDPVGALQFLEQAQQYTKGHPVSGWMAMVSASAVAKQDKKKQCELFINHALETASNVSDDDLFYTDFNLNGTNAFAGNCLIKVGEPAKALERLLAVNLEALSKNRLASAYYDIATAHCGMGELEATQTYAFQSIDYAVETDRTYIIHRFMNLAQKIQQQDPHESHTTSILEYAHQALLNGGHAA
jgi:transcriptional regulator with XRE-family HTH domain